MADGVLSRIPGLAGYLSGQANDQQMQMGQLQQMGALQGIMARQQAQQEQQHLRGVLSRVAQETGGDPTKMGPMLIQTGDPKLMELGQRMIPKPVNPQFVNTVDENGNPVQKAVIPTAGMTLPSQPRQAPNTTTELEKLMMLRDRLKTEGRDVTAVENAIRKQSETAAQIVPRIVMPRAEPAPIATDQGYFNRGPKGLTPLMNPNNPNQQLRPPSLVSGGNQQALALRRDFNANPEVKLANSLEPRVGPAAEYVATVGTGMGNPVGDAELVKLWLMTTHPKGDQISNLDYQRIQSMPDLWGRVKNVAGNFAFGKTLDSDTRADMWKSISQKYKATASMREKYRKDVIGRGKNMNIDESLIFAPQQE